MELKLTNGAYSASSAGGLAAVTGAEELAQRVAMKLTARRGGYAPWPNYGSRLYALTGERPDGLASQARQYVAEALSDEEGVAVEDVTARVANGVLTLLVTLSAEDDTLEVSVEL